MQPLEPTLSLSLSPPFSPTFPHHHFPWGNYQNTTQCTLGMRDSLSNAHEYIVPTHNDTHLKLNILN